jgi:hypothetical protein
MSKANAVEQEMLELVNAERAKIGVAPLTFDDRLNDASEDHSSWMLENNIFNHTGAQGSKPADRVQDAGYKLEGTSAVGENIGWQSERGAPGISDDVAQIHESLMNSPGHRAAILNPLYTEIGIGVENGPFTTGGTAWDSVMVTQNFGTTDAVDDTPATPVTPEEPVTPVTPDPDDVAEVDDPVEEPETVPDTDTSDPDVPETTDDDTTPMDPLDPADKVDVATLWADNFDWSDWGNTDVFRVVFSGNGTGNSDWWNDLFQTNDAPFAPDTSGNANTDVTDWSRDALDAATLAVLPEPATVLDDCFEM